MSIQRRVPFLFALLLLGAFAFVACVQVRVTAAPPAQASSVAWVASKLMAPLSAELTGKIAVVRGGAVLVWQGGSLKQLTWKERYEGPSWSPDSSRLAIVLRGDNHSDVVVLDEDGNQLDQLTHFFSPVSVSRSVWARHPAWSPDGSKIAYCSDSSSTDLGLWVMDADGSNKRLLVQPLGSGGLDWPSWSPDGTEIAFSAFIYPVSQIYTANVTAGVATPLTSQAGGAYDPAWSPDGRHIAYVAREGDRNDIWVSNVDGTEATRITQTGSSVSPAWSPDGQYLAYLTLYGKGFDLEAARLEEDGRMGLKTAQTWRLTQDALLEGPSGVSWTK